MHCDEFDFPRLDAPGLKARPSRAIPKRLYWVARADLVKAGYRPETVRICFDITDPANHRLIERACQHMQAEMLSWKAGIGRQRRAFDGTIVGLCRAYQIDDASDFKRVKWNTRRTYAHDLALIERAFGQRSLAALHLADFRRWYEEAKKPKVHGGRERLRKAHGIMKMLRRIIRYGVAAELPECARLHEILRNTTFKEPAPRRVHLDRHHVETFIACALSHGRLSLALGTALQFESGMRQRDVIGEWTPILGGDKGTGITLNGRRWQNGMVWSDIGPDLTFSKCTTKTGAWVSHDLKLFLVTARLLELVTKENRIGPLIVDERSRRPYAETKYSKEWRVIARAAGLPSEICNMDARAGAITEAEDAGADIDAIRGAVGHTHAKTTARYSRGPLGKSREIAKLRTAHGRAPKDTA